MKYYTLIAATVALFVLTACEGKKSLDGHPMDKPPPSAFAPRDSEPNFAEPVVTDETDTIDVADDSDEDDSDEVVNETGDTDTDTDTDADADGVDD